MIICTEPMSAEFPGLRDIVTIHEVVHQWFYGIVNSDQANTPFLDETVTDYFTERLVEHCMARAVSSVGGDGLSTMPDFSDCKV